MDEFPRGALRAAIEGLLPGTGRRGPLAMPIDGFLDLLAEHTALFHPSLCPELRTRESVVLVPLWERAEVLAGTEVEPPFWAYSWPGSQALARYVLDHPEVVCGKRVLDLGCGNGISAVAAARSGASLVVANDIDRAALWMTAIHGVENAVTLEYIIDDLLGDSRALAYEVILAGDLFYAQDMAGRVESCLRRAALDGVQVLVGDPGRKYLPRCAIRELAVYDVAVPLEIESVPLRRTRVLGFDREW